MSLIMIYVLAGMAELADALDSGSSESNFMQVQVLFPAPIKRRSSGWMAVFLFYADFYSFAGFILLTATQIMIVMSISGKVLPTMISTFIISL